MSEVEWREITWDNAHDHIGKPVRVKSKHLELSGILSWANDTYFDLMGGMEGDDLNWEDYGLFYAWYPAVSGNIVLTEPASIKKFVENMNAQGEGRL